MIRPLIIGILVTQVLSGPVDYERACDDLCSCIKTYISQLLENRNSTEGPLPLRPTQETSYSPEKSVNQSDGKGQESVLQSSNEHGTKMKPSSSASGRRDFIGPSKTSSRKFSVPSYSSTGPSSSSKHASSSSSKPTSPSSSKSSSSKPASTSSSKSSSSSSKPASPSSSKSSSSSSSSSKSATSSPSSSSKSATSSSSKSATSSPSKPASSTSSSSSKPVSSSSSEPVSSSSSKPASSSSSKPDSSQDSSSERPYSYMNFGPNDESSDYGEFHTIQYGSEYSSNHDNLDKYEPSPDKLETIFDGAEQTKPFENDVTQTDASEVSFEPSIPIYDEDDGSKLNKETNNAKSQDEGSHSVKTESDTAEAPKTKEDSFSSDSNKHTAESDAPKKIVVDSENDGVNKEDGESKSKSVNPFSSSIPDTSFNFPGATPGETYHNGTTKNQASASTNSSKASENDEPRLKLFDQSVSQAHKSYSSYTPASSLSDSSSSINGICIFMKDKQHPICYTCKHTSKPFNN